MHFVTPGTFLVLFTADLLHTYPRFIPRVKRQLRKIPMYSGNGSLSNQQRLSQRYWRVIYNLFLSFFKCLQLMSSFMF